ncbi:MAG: CooT family nickel-binding protein [Bacillota bacterium]|nr:CooT family nickel-binding protein [Bacillota bacterium]
MCEANAYVVTDDQEELLLPNVASVEREGTKLLLVDLFGEQKLIEGEIVRLDLLNHKIIIKRLA